MTEDQQRELETMQPAQAHDPRTNQTYVLGAADVYERMRAILAGYTKRAGWDDPQLDAYEIYRKKL